MRAIPLLALTIVAGPLALGGCVASVAAGAVDLAVRGAQSRPVRNEGYQPNALSDCTTRATPYGKVEIIDVEQHTASRIIVWGTVDDGKQKRSFQCDYGTKISGFKLRTIPPRG